ncbi:hypothetical protein J4468_03210 [Candidatus Woesearchaeota archaeon]|nr:hypothetical protein [Candidatus Woesearchaeota archaeon]
MTKLQEVGYEGCIWELEQILQNLRLERETQVLRWTYQMTPDGCIKAEYHPKDLKDTKR